MRKIIILLMAIGFTAGLTGANLAQADGTNSNSNTNTGGGTVTNVTWGYVKCLYGPNPGSCAGAKRVEPVDDKTAG